MSLKEITYDPSLLPIKSLRQSGHFQQLNKEKRYLCKCIAIRNIVFGNGACKWIACEYFMSLNLMNPQEISKTECPARMKQY